MTATQLRGVLSLAFVIFFGWLLWPTRYDRVMHLDSRGHEVIAFGDSLTAGYGAQPGEDYPSRLAAAIGVPVINAGVSGDTTEAALARAKAEAFDGDPRIVLVGLGGNDFLQGVPIATTERNLRTIIHIIHGRGAMVVLLGFRFPSLSASYEKMYANVAKEEHCLLVDDLLDGILSNPSLKSDEIHPNARGYQLVADRIAAPLRKLIAKANRAIR